jgi:hypothetical protein
MRIKELNKYTRSIGLFVLLVTIIATGMRCSSKSNTSSSSGSIQLSGTVGNGYMVAANSPKNIWEWVRSPFIKTAYAQLTGKKVDKVLAIQSDRGYLAAYSMQNSKSATIGADGTFSLSLDTKEDWLLVLLDTTAAQKLDQFVGYIALNTGSPDSLLQLPASTAKVSSLNLGTVTASTTLTDTANSQNTINPMDFSLTQQQLLAVAKNDDAFKSVKNFVINYDSTSGVYYALRPDFKWYGSYAGIDGNFQDPNQYIYNCYNSQLDSNTTSVTIDKICGTNGNKQVIVSLAPPADVSATGMTPTVIFNASNPISSTGVVCNTATDGFIDARNGYFYATNRYGNVSQSYYVGLGGTIPTGYWTYYEDGVPKGQFDVAVASPLDSNNKIKGFVPVIKVNKDNNSKITSIDIKWYAWDSSAGQYTELTDISILKYLLGNGDVYLDNTTNNTRTYESISYDPSINTSVSPSTYTWYYGTAGPANQQAQGIGIFYQSGGVGYFFEYFRQ